MAAIDDGLLVEKHYRAVKLHFAGKFDCARYGVNVSGSVESFQKRRDKYQFITLSRKLQRGEILNFMVANAIDRLGELPWVGELLDKKAFDIHAERLGRLSSLDYVFKTDCRTIVRLLGTSSREWVTLGNGAHPPLATLAMRNEISPETYAIVLKILDCAPTIGDGVTDEIFWPRWHKTMVKQGDFLSLDLKAFAKVLRSSVE